MTHHAIIASNFELGSDKYYRSLLTPSYDRMKATLRENVLDDDRPDCVSVCLDGGLLTITVWSPSNGTSLSQWMEQSMLNLQLQKCLLNRVLRNHHSLLD